MDLAILGMLGQSPSFVGIVDRDTDSKIQIPAKKKKSEAQVKRCSAKVVTETTGLMKTLNTGNTVMSKSKVYNAMMT